MLGIRQLTSAFDVSQRPCVRTSHFWLLTPHRTLSICPVQAIGLVWCALCLSGSFLECIGHNCPLVRWSYMPVSDGCCASPILTCFFVILAFGLVPTSMASTLLDHVGFQYVLCEVLIYVAFVQSTFPTYWTTKQTLANSLVQLGLVAHQIPKSKLNGPTIHFPCTLLAMSTRITSRSARCSSACSVWAVE
jgi:hypothetical protein